jgi:hypothetical protein
VGVALNRVGNDFVERRAGYLHGTPGFRR